MLSRFLRFLASLILENLHVVGGEESELAVTLSYPPALVNLGYMDTVTGDKVDNNEYGYGHKYEGRKDLTLHRLGEPTISIFVMTSLGSKDISSSAMAW